MQRAHHTFSAPLSSIKSHRERITWEELTTGQATYLGEGYSLDYMLYVINHLGEETLYLAFSCDEKFELVYFERDEIGRLMEPYEDFFKLDKTTILKAVFPKLEAQQ